MESGYPPMHVAKLHIPFLSGMSKPQYLNHLNKTLRKSFMDSKNPMDSKKEYIFSCKYGVGYYQPKNKTLRIYQNPEADKLLDTSESAQQMMAKILSLGANSALKDVVRRHLKRPRVHMVSSRGITIPKAGAILMTCATKQETGTYFDLGVQLENQAVISWTHTRKCNLQHWGDPTIMFPGSDGETPKTTLTHIITGFGSLSNTHGVVRFSAYNGLPLMQWNTRGKCTCKPFALVISPSGDIYVLPVPTSEAELRVSDTKSATACVAAVFKIEGDQMSIRPTCVAGFGKEESHDSPAIRKISEIGMQMARSM